MPCWVAIQRRNNQVRQPVRCGEMALPAGFPKRDTFSIDRPPQRSVRLLEKRHDVARRRPHRLKAAGNEPVHTAAPCPREQRVAAGDQRVDIRISKAALYAKHPGDARANATEAIVGSPGPERPFAILEERTDRL